MMRQGQPVKPRKLDPNEYKYTDISPIETPENHHCGLFKKETIPLKLKSSFTESE